MIVLTLLLVLGLAAAIIRLSYFLRIVRGIILLNGVGFEYLWPSRVPLVIFGTVVFSLVLKFRKQLD